MLLWSWIVLATILDKIEWNSKPTNPPPEKKKWRMKPRKSQNAPFSLLDLEGEGVTNVPSILLTIYNLGQNKMENPNPHPLQIKDEEAQKPKRAIFPSLIWGWGWGWGYKFSIYFVQDCSLYPTEAKMFTTNIRHLWRFFHGLVAFF